MGKFLYMEAICKRLPPRKVYVDVRLLERIKLSLNAQCIQLADETALTAIHRESVELDVKGAALQLDNIHLMSVADRKRLDSETFKYLHHSSLVIDELLTIGEHFRTDDTFIFAAGNIARAKSTLKTRYQLWIPLCKRQSIGRDHLIDKPDMGFFKIRIDEYGFIQALTYLGSTLFVSTPPCELHILWEQLERWHASDYIGLYPSADLESAEEWDNAIKSERKTLFAVSRDVKDGSLHARIMSLGNQKVAVGQLNLEVVRLLYLTNDDDER
ncbi:hypothetical protein SeLEV6574_g04953 [Synchytrium endobioticum]|uniref:Uncharacterized protein n=1 Tax=Synchytrium endobioticum TaxID=286115 RepID=A0A507CWJ6_9FUNG|nr:hypothetical protein SeLEV6574_g04953 [Synchytrium endobioticum]